MIATPDTAVAQARAKGGRAAPLPPDERRRAILRAVLPVVRERGADVTTRELAEAAGVAEGTLFRVFDDKASLVRDAVGSAVDPSDLFELMDGMDVSTPLEDRLALLVSAWLRRMQDVMLWMTVLHQLRKDSADQHGDQHAHRDWARRQGEFAAGFRRRLQTMLEPDADRLAQPVPMAADLLEIALIGAAARTAGAARTGQHVEPVSAPALVGFVLNGILGPADRPEPAPRR
ncbi:TetR/AcrR family transcriptional regulator [Cellulomonas sp. SG140]|uniref:TetR/AcrR family transcriptional regulator n=1 Tax=Cellulomonas sp. SG140 TaxID=2976536 RepID=UPI0021E8107A|nr:TetR/AcrR family transcriptional regulator [Cellulomonas sp. SG140]